MNRIGSLFILHPSSFILLISSGSIVPEGPSRSTSARALAADCCKLTRMEGGRDAAVGRHGRGNRDPLVDAPPKCAGLLRRKRHQEGRSVIPVSGGVCGG